MSKVVDEAFVSTLCNVITIEAGFELVNEYILVCAPTQTHNNDEHHSIQWIAAYVCVCTTFWHEYCRCRCMWVHVCGRWMSACECKHEHLKYIILPLWSVRINSLFYQHFVQPIIHLNPKPYLSLPLTLSLVVQILSNTTLFQNCLKLFKSIVYVCVCVCAGCRENCAWPGTIAISRLDYYALYTVDTEQQQLHSHFSKCIIYGCVSNGMAWHGPRLYGTQLHTNPYFMHESVEYFGKCLHFSFCSRRGQKCCVCCFVLFPMIHYYVEHPSFKLNSIFLPVLRLCVAVRCSNIALQCIYCSHTHPHTRIYNIRKLFCWIYSKPPELCSKNNNNAFILSSAGAHVIFNRILQIVLFFIKRGRPQPPHKLISPQKFRKFGRVEFCVRLVSHSKLK